MPAMISASREFPRGVAELCIAARSLYVHVPFCRRRCGYCDFSLLTGRDHWIPPYLRAVERELQSFAFSHPLETIFFGGGTPTHLANSELEHLFRLVNAIPRQPSCEISVEANPNDLTSEKLECLQSLGVTRLSVGAQSFQADKLRRLERTHSSDQAREALRRARDSGLDTSVDLIFGVDGESLEDWVADLDIAIGLEVTHVSTYQLTIEKGTSFWSRRRRGESLGVVDELGANLYETAIARLTSAGFEHYEVSNFCRPGFACRHNEAYWLCEEYVGVGPGAASFCGGARWKNHSGVVAYVRRVLADRSPIVERERLAPEPAARERLIFGLRRLAGVDLAAFRAATGFAVEQLAGDLLSRWESAGLIELDALTLRLTRRGLLISDTLWPDLV
jgi:oxygen-independent coproporphyrinogen-3 oxidase